MSWSPELVTAVGTAVVLPLTTLFVVKVGIPLCSRIYELIKDSGRAEEYKRVTTEALLEKNKELDAFRKRDEERVRELEECRAQHAEKDRMIERLLRGRRAT